MCSANNIAEMSMDQDWIRTEANFDRIRIESDCRFFLIGGSGLDCFNVIIVKISKF